MAVWSQTKVSEISKSKRIDSEYFHPSYLEAENAVLKRNVKPLKHIGQFLIGPFGSAFHVSNYDLNSPYRYIRGKDVKPFQLLDDDSVYMPPRDFERLNRYSIKENDLLISVVGTLGNVAIVPEGLQGVFSCKSTIFRNSCIDPYFLLAYFNSSYGKSCLLRRQRGAIQAGLNKDDLEEVPVPVFDPEMCSDVGDKVRMALDKNRLSKSLYSEAQKLLEKELGLDQLALERPKSYETSFSEVVSRGRIDSDYFQVHFKQQANHLSMIQSKPLREIVDLQKGIEVGSPAYTSSGNLFVRVSNVKKMGVVTGNSDKYISETLFNSLVSYQPKIGDILLTKDGTVGVCYVVDESVDGIISGGIMKLSKKDETIPSEYLALVINSPICQFQIDRDCSGALIVHWKPKDIAALKIPILTEDKMAELSDLVNQSKIAKKESEQLLDQAKRMVEELIEGSI